MSAQTYLRSRVDPIPTVGVIAVGDVLAVSAFVVIGQISHGEQPLQNPEIVPGALAPFLIGWFVVAFVGGLYTADAVTTIRRAVSWTVPAWVFGALLAQGVRATSLFPGGTAVTFVVVSIVTGGVLVVGWRSLAAYVTS